MSQDPERPEPSADPEWDDIAAAWLSAVALIAVGAGLLGAAAWFGLRMILEIAADPQGAPLTADGLRGLLVVMVGVFGGVMVRRGVAGVRRLLAG